MDDLFFEEKKKIKSLILTFDSETDLTEEQENKIIDEIERLSPDPYITNYIFGKKYEHLSVDEIIEKAFSYQPIILPDQSRKDEE